MKNLVYEGLSLLGLLKLVRHFYLLLFFFFFHLLVHRLETHIELLYFGKLSLL